jgi:hypothetical protein
VNDLKVTKSSERFDQFYIAVDDLRVGGIQRLAMDEAYALAAKRLRTSIICFTQSRQEDSILALDGVSLKSLSTRGIEVIYIDNDSKIAKVVRLAKLIKSKKIGSVICHSPSSAAMFRAAGLLMRSSVKINLWIHQLISLSDPVQKLKRILYSFCANELFFSSKQFKLEWELERFDRILQKLFFLKRNSRQVCRLGVHLPRVIDSIGRFSCKDEKRHLIFASRVTSWKGVDTFLSISKLRNDIHSVLMSVNLRDEILQQFDCDSDANHLIEGKPPSFLSEVSNPIHLYPTNYGSKTRFPQSIGLNVIEFAALGIPSLVSKEVLTSYPELFDSGLVSSVDWDDYLEVGRKIEILSSISAEVRHEKALWVREYCSIETHLNTLMTSNLSYKVSP